MAELLTVRGLTLAFGGLRALDGVSLDVAQGSIGGLIGPNGAGKTSLLNCLSGFYRPQSGTATLAGVRVLHRSPHVLASLGVGRTFQHMEIFPSLSVMENTLLGTQVHHRPRIMSEALGFWRSRAAEKQRTKEACDVLHLVGLGDVTRDAVGALPLGDQKRVGLARALACRPRLLLLDEPAGGLNTTEKGELTSLLRRLHEKLGLTILLIEHDMDLVTALCDSVTVLDFGRRIAMGPPAALRDDPAVVAGYLGETSPTVGFKGSVHAPTAPHGTPLLDVRGLRVAYGDVTAVYDLSLTVEAGQAVTLLGANGAGKSSALRAIGGLIRPSSGEIRLAGTRVDGWSAERLVRSGLALVPDTRDLFPHFTVAENLRMGAFTRPAREFAAGRDEALSLFPALARHLDRPAGMLSGGEQQMLALARALLSRPRLLLLDEPSLGLAPLVVEAIFTNLATVLSHGTAILVVEQATSAALHLASYAYILRNGHVALEGPSATLRDDPRVLDLYLGGELESFRPAEQLTAQKR
jgi:branched-chain amino acid transport system ATP-binding protein